MRIGRVKQDCDVAISFRLVMRSEHILLDMLLFFNLAMTVVVYYEAQNPRINRRGLKAPDGTEGPFCLLTTVSKELFSNVYRLELFAIVWDLHFWATESWLAFQRSHKMD